MKYKFKTCAIAIIAAALASITLSASVNVVIDWHQPDNYTDLGTHFHDRTDLETFKKELEPHIVRIANDHLPDGATLQLTITNVDLAGEFEPWGIEGDVRIVRSVYPPKMSLEYRVYDARDQLINSGKADIVNPTFDFNIGQRVAARDHYFYERDLIASWIRNNLSVTVSKIIQKRHNKA